jgi:hypothetical protein
MRQETAKSDEDRDGEAAIQQGRIPGPDLLTPAPC